MSRLRWPSGWIVAATVLVSAVLGVSIYRAATRSIVHDEAYTYNMFICGPVSNALKVNPSNHVLHTWLARLSVWFLGSSELSVRVATLLGTVLYLGTVLATVHLTFPRGRWVLIAVALACLNPLLMDFYPCARGYTLALAFLMSGILYLLGCTREESLHGPSWKTLVPGGILLGLSVAASFTFLIPAAAVGGVFILMTWGESTVRFLSRFLGRLRRSESLAGQAGTPPAEADPGNGHPDKGASQDRPPHPAPRPVRGTSSVIARARNVIVFGLCVAVVAAVAVVVPLYLQGLMKNDRPFANDGYRSWEQSAADIVNASFFSQETARIDLPGDLTIKSAAEFPEWAIVGSVMVVAAVLFLITILTGARLLRHGMNALSLTTRGALLFCGTVCLCGAFYGASHVLLGIPYPWDRRGLYVVPLISIGMLLGLLAWSRRPRLLEWFVLILCLVGMGRYAMELNLPYFRTWAFDADSREVFVRMEGMAGTRPPESVRVGGDWRYEPSMNFYRQTRHAEWMAPFTRVMDQSRLMDRPSESYDFFLLSRTESGTFDAKGFKIIFRGPVSGIVLYAGRSLLGQDAP